MEYEGDVRAIVAFICGATLIVIAAIIADAIEGETDSERMRSCDVMCDIAERPQYINGNCTCEAD